MEPIVNLVLLFFVYAIAGWCMEVILKYRQFHRFINRGFLTGPWLPIYGFGTVLITLGVNAIAGVEHSVGTTFLISFFLCGTVEYVASWIMEKRFHARWWDYSQKPMNLNGRVWIGNLILFGLAGVGIEYVANPLLFKLFDRISLRARAIIACALLVVIAADYVVTHFVLKLVKTGVETSEADNTEQISKEVRLLLSDRNYFYSRFADAYPEVIYRTERINERMNAIRAETERLRREVEERRNAMGQRIEQGREQLAATLEPTGSIRGSLLRDQQALIDLLYDEQSATEEMKALKGDIDRNTERLKGRRAL
ncbi:MAG: putative ABC transporter permease [Clostridia bacterium]|nr:putative ABC transporter permease [Clostridia bacterium]